MSTDKPISRSLFTILAFCSFALLPLTNTVIAPALDDSPRLKRTTNAAGQPLRSRININRIGSWYDADGTEEINSTTGYAGLQYPKGTAGAIYTAGLIWSGLHRDGLDPLVRTNGHVYNTGLQTGAIIGVRTGIPEDPDAQDVRIWRIRRKFAEVNLAEDAADMNDVTIGEVTTEQIEAVRSQYETDWLEWPAHKGAPFYDASEDGIYQPVLIDGRPVLYPDADEPGMAEADQVIWYVANDLTGTSPWGGFKAGLEIQQTIWAYDRDDPIGDAVFKRYRMVYKGTDSTSTDARIDSMYFGQWSDPDLGIFGDDYAGCDSILGLGFCYNSSPTDAQYEPFGLPPPAIGYVMLQGPLVLGIAGEDRNKNGIDDAADNGIFDIKQTESGFINLPLTSFVYEDAYFSPPFNSDGGLQRYCQLQGLASRPLPCGYNQIDPFTGQPAGRFWLYAGSDGFSAPNPSAPNGWVDGQIDGPGDRRFVLSSGPFTLALGDSQEMVIAVVGGLGNDNLNSVTRLKSNTRMLRSVYSDLLNLPAGPARPNVDAFGFDRQILLDWEFDEEAVRATEDSVAPGGYILEGYKVYQFPDETGDFAGAKLIARFDLVNGVRSITQHVRDPVTGELFLQNVEYGTDNGIRRSLAISADSLRDGSPLVNGRVYYYGVSAYNYTYDSLQQVRTYESEPALVVVQPETPKPGTRYPYGIGDTLQTVVQISGHSDAVIRPIVYDPRKQAGETYRLLFEAGEEDEILWTLTNPAASDTIYSAIPIAPADSAYRVHESGLDLFLERSPTGVISVVDQGGNNLFGSLVLGVDTTLAGFNGRTPETGEDYEIRFGEESFALSTMTFLINQVIRVPFTVYDVGRGIGGTAPRKVMIAVRDSGGTATGGEWGLTPHGIRLNDSTYQVFEPVYGSSYDYVPDDPGTAIREDSLAIASMSSELRNITFNSYSRPSQAFYAAFIVDVDGDSLPPSSGIIRFNKYHELRPGDEYEIALDRVITGDVNLARGDIDAINVFPNPYYGANLDETPSSGQFMTFNHLPAKAMIRIYNLGGIHVRNLQKDDPSTQYHRWDLRTEHGKPVGSGIYLAHMELKDENGVDLGVKVLKIAVIQSAR